MKYLDKQIERVIKTKNRAQSDLKDLQNNYAKYLLSSNELYLLQSDCNRYHNEMTFLYEKIKQCELIIQELILLKEMNEQQ